MASVNKVILIGNLGRDPEMRYTPQENAVCNFTVATNEKWTDKAGQKQEHTEWHRVVVWGKQAEICNQYLKKGKQVYIEGSLTTREWNDKEGHKRSTTEIRARNVVMLGRAEGGQSAGGRAEGSPAQFSEPDPEFSDDDIPF